MLPKPSKSAVAAALQHCAAEAVHIPAQIQPHGALIGVDNETLEITYASESIRNFLRASYENLLGKTLDSVFGSKTRHLLLDGMKHCTGGQKAWDLGLVDFAGTPFLVSCAASDGTTIFEIEDTTNGEDRSFKSFTELELLLGQVRAAPDRNALFETSVDLLQVLTGYHRVMVYEFDSEGNGSVVAETKTTGLHPYLGLSFPSWDIPEQARRMMRAVPLRYIADVNASGASVHAARPRLAELDMTYTHLRGVSPVHIEYLRNMEVRATFTLNVVVEGRLWGMISLHHSAPRYPGQRVRQVCRNFISFFAQHLSNFHMSDQIDNLRNADALRRQLLDTSNPEGQIQTFEKALLANMCSALDADGAGLIKGNALVTTGSVPSDDVMYEIISAMPNGDEIITTSNIAHDYPALHKSLGSRFAGLLVAQKPGEFSFVFLRYAKDRTVRWAGAPEKTVHLDNGVARLNPRASFAEYKLKVKNTSRRWTSEQCRIAEELWSILITSQRKALLEKTDRQQSGMVNEMNERLRSILTLIRSSSPQTLPDSGSTENNTSALKAHISAAMNVYETRKDASEPTATLVSVFQHETQPQNQQQGRVRIKGPDAAIRPDLAPVLALVVHEMMTNVAKHGALSVPEGHVDVQLEKISDGIEITWQEVNGPPTVSPEVKNFGIKLMETSVPSELGGTLDVSYKPQGLHIKIAVPSDALVSTVPVPFVQGGKKVTPDQAAASQVANFHGKTCLFLGDNTRGSLVAAQVLWAVGFERIETALNVSEAFDSLDHFSPSVAILDIEASQGGTAAPVALELIARCIPFGIVCRNGCTARLDDVFANAAVLKKPLRENELRVFLNDLNL